MSHALGHSCNAHSLREQRHHDGERTGDSSGATSETGWPYPKDHVKFHQDGVLGTYLGVGNAIGLQNLYSTLLWRRLLTSISFK